MEYKNPDTGIKIALGVMLVTFLYLFMVTFMPVPATGNEHAKTIVGFLLGTAFSTLINYYWGNSHKEGPPPTITEVDQAAIDAAKKIAEIKVTDPVIQPVKEEVKSDATKNQ